MYNYDVDLKKNGTLKLLIKIIKQSKIYYIKKLTRG